MLNEVTKFDAPVMRSSATAILSCRMRVMRETSWNSFWHDSEMFVIIDHQSNSRDSIEILLRFFSRKWKKVSERAREERGKEKGGGGRGTDGPVQNSLQRLQDWFSWGSLDNSFELVADQFGIRWITGILYNSSEMPRDSTWFSWDSRMLVWCFPKCCACFWRARDSAEWIDADCDSLGVDSWASHIAFLQRFSPAFQGSEENLFDSLEAPITNYCSVFCWGCWGGGILPPLLHLFVLVADVSGALTFEGASVDWLMILQDSVGILGDNYAAVSIHRAVNKPERRFHWIFSGRFSLGNRLQFIVQMFILRR